MIFGDGEQTRDFTYVENAVQANLWRLKHPAMSRAKFSMSASAAVSLNKVVELLGKISGHPMEAKHEPNRDGDIRDSQADINAARNFLGYEAPVDFEEGLRRTFEWYKTVAAAAAAKAARPTRSPLPQSSRHRKSNCFARPGLRATMSGSRRIGRVAMGFLQEFRYALRQLIQSPGFTVDRGYFSRARRIGPQRRHSV